MKPLAGDIRMQVSLSDMVKVMWCRPGLRNSSNQSNPSVDSICSRNLWSIFVGSWNSAAAAIADHPRTFWGWILNLGSGWNMLWMGHKAIRLTFRLNYCKVKVKVTWFR